MLAQQLLLVLIGQVFFDVNYARQALALFRTIVVLAAWAASPGLFIVAISKREENVIVLSLVAMSWLFSLSI